MKTKETSKKIKKKKKIMLKKKEDIQGGLVQKIQFDLVNPEHYLVFRFLTELNTLV